MHRLAICSFTALTLSACGDDTALPDDAPETCIVGEDPTLVLAVPDLAGAESPTSTFSYWAADQRLRWSRQAPSGASEFFQRDLCGGEPERALAADHGLSWPFIAEGPAGPLLFARDEEGQVYFADRLDVPGADTPRPLARVTLAGAVSTHFSERGGFDLEAFQHDKDRAIGAAGLGGNTGEIWVHTGRPEDDLELLAADVVSATLSTSEPDRWILFDDGDLSLIDRDTLEETPVRQGVRSFLHAWRGDRPFLLYQAIGDGAEEAVYLLDLTDQSQVQVTTNPFTAKSFGQDPEHPSAGRWISSPVLGLLGPEGTIVQAFNAETLDPITVPKHVGLAGIATVRHVLGLRLEDPTDHVYAIWDPAADTLTEWYRGPEEPQRATWRDGEIRYELPNADDTRRLLAFDPATGARRTLVERLGLLREEFDDGAILHTLPLADDELARQVVLTDPSTGQTTELVARAHDVQFGSDLLFYVDTDAETPGVWAMRLPPR